MTLQAVSQNRTQQGGVVAGSAAIMFAAAATTEGLFSSVMFVAAIGMILSALALFAAVYRERKN
jgi:hypothetical protein